MVDNTKNAVENAYIASEVNLTTKKYGQFSFISLGDGDHISDNDPIENECDVNVEHTPLKGVENCSKEDCVEEDLDVKAVPGPQEAVKLQFKSVVHGKTGQKYKPLRRKVKGRVRKKVNPTWGWTRGHPENKAKKDREMLGEPKPYRNSTWAQTQRIRWNMLNAECKKKGIDGLPWEAYKAVWEAAGVVKTPWGKEYEAYKLQAKHWDERFKCVLIREDDSREIGFKPGNVMVVAVEGCFRNPSVDRPLVHYEELAQWLQDGSIVDREGNLVNHVVP